MKKRRSMLLLVFLLLGCSAGSLPKETRLNEEVYLYHSVEIPSALGELLIKEKEDVFIEFLEKEMNTYKNIIVSLNGNETEAGINRKQEIEELIRLATLAKEMKI